MGEFFYDSIFPRFSAWLAKTELQDIKLLWMGIVRKLWVMVVPFGRDTTKNEAVAMFNIMLIMSGPSEALRLIRLKFYGTLAAWAERGEVKHVASKSSPNQQPVRGFWRNQKTHTLSKSKLGSIEKKNNFSNSVCNFIRIGTPYDRSTSRTWTTFNRENDGNYIKRTQKANSKPRRIEAKEREKKVVT